MQEAFFKFSRWCLYGLILAILQAVCSASDLQAFSLDEAFYRTTLYEENYILPLHYILTRVDIDSTDEGLVMQGSNRQGSNIPLSILTTKAQPSKNSIPLPMPAMSEGLQQRVKHRKSLADYNALKRKSAMIRDRYPFNNAKEVAFQTSFKVPLVFINSTHTQFYFGYTARSWWQCYTGISAFFREIEQKADFFIEQPFFISSTAKGVTDLHFEKLKIGFLHHSNGEGLAFERSCNRIYIALFMRWFTGDNKFVYPVCLRYASA